MGVATCCYVHITGARSSDVWSDKETVDDCLGFEAYVETLITVVLEEDMAPVTVGIFGDWGSGKTSLMRMMEQQLTAQGTQIVTVWFNPWQYEGKNEVQTALIHVILDGLKSVRTFGDKASKLFQKLLRSVDVLKLGKCIMKSILTLSPDIGGLLDSLSVQENEMAETMQNFNAMFGAFLDTIEVSRLVVFVDDLDRCESLLALELFETIQLFLSTPKCAFVIGADSEKIATAIRQRYESDEGTEHVSKDYLEKVVQIPFRIPQQSPTDINVYVQDLIVLPHIQPEARSAFRKAMLDARKGNQDINGAASQWLTENQKTIQTSLKNVQTETDSILPHLNTITSGLKGNPRQIKRFLNMYDLRKNLATTNNLEIDNALLVKLQVMEYSWPEVFKFVSDSFDTESGKSLILDNLYGSLAESTDDSKLVGTLLNTPGLEEFLTSEPVLQSVDLRPYMFLAQIALEKHPMPIMATAQETAAQVVEGVTSGDKARLRLAINQAKNLDTHSIDIVIKQCTPRIMSTDSLVASTTVMGLDELLLLAPLGLGVVVDALDSVPDSTDIGLKIASSTLLRRHESKCTDPETRVKMESLIERLKTAKKTTS
jgi:hypothetical protein